MPERPGEMKIPRNCLGVHEPENTRLASKDCPYSLLPILRRIAAIFNGGMLRSWAVEFLCMVLLRSAGLA